VCQLRNLLYLKYFGSVPPGDYISHVFDAHVIVAEILHTPNARISLHDIAQQLLTRTQNLRPQGLERFDDG